MTTYLVTPKEIASITDAEMAFATTRLLPTWDDIPDNFKSANAYTELVDAIFAGKPLPDGEVVMKAGFEPHALNRAVQAHLQSFAPSHEHKVAGVAYMISCACELVTAGENA